MIALTSACPIDNSLLMKMSLLVRLAALGFLTVGCRQPTNGSVAADKRSEISPHAYSAKGIVRDLKPDGRTVVIEHEAISDYMPAMTMPFKARQPKELAGLRESDAISFRLLVSGDESWVDQIAKTGRAEATQVRSTILASGTLRSAPGRHPLLNYKFTNELGQAVSLSQFNGQALAITFFFTRCPIPEFCPRLSRNFEEAIQKLNASPDAPTNWHFLSVSFDPEFDTPAVLKAYGERYHYDPKHWSFLTGPPEKIAELARQSDVNFGRDGGFFNHNFRTLIIDAAGRLQTIFPVSGNLSDAIVSEMMKATTVTNQ
ncbi:MAG: SCO family protein [Verrucomicrobia bacterium]|nr:SCO family protein [Verrucomicrobiota bacterium]